MTIEDYMKHVYPLFLSNIFEYVCNLKDEKANF